MTETDRLKTESEIRVRRSVENPARHTGELNFANEADMESAERIFGSVHAWLSRFAPNAGGLIPVHRTTNGRLLDVREDSADYAPGDFDSDGYLVVGPFGLDETTYVSRDLDELKLWCGECFAWLGQGDGSDETADRLGLIAIKHGLSTGHGTKMINPGACGIWSTR